MFPFRANYRRAAEEIKASKIKINSLLHLMKWNTVEIESIPLAGSPMRVYLKHNQR